MRKILSIVIALGLILTLGIMATPAAGQVPGSYTGCANVTVTSTCESDTGNWTITFVSNITLLGGTDVLSVTFGAGTDLTGVTKNSITVEDITHAAGPTSPISCDKTGAPRIEFPVPIPVIWAGDNVTIFVGNTKNPTPGPYTLCLDYDLACCPGVTFCCVPYTIKPHDSKYSLGLNFSKTYAGIKYDFVPPFKACGQDDQVNNPSEFDTTYIDPNWYDIFDIVFNVTTVGCYVPCSSLNTTLVFDVSGFPSATAEVHIAVNSTVPVTLNSTKHSGNISNVVLDLSNPVALESLLHFSETAQPEPAVYTICFTLVCATDGSVIIPAKCYQFKVWQSKDAFKIELFEKWNLISLPLIPFDSDIEAVLASLPDAVKAKIQAIWNYDATATPPEDWLCYTPGVGLDTLDEIVDGKSYWFRLNYPLTDDPYALWVWGTEMPEPMGPPAEYAVYEGWNMFGFTNMGSELVENYLWNWYDLAFTPFPIVYGWISTPNWAADGWELVQVGDNLNAGQGYWGAFPVDGPIYQFVA